MTTDDLTSSGSELLQNGGGPSSVTKPPRQPRKKPEPSPQPPPPPAAPEGDATPDADQTPKEPDQPQPALPTVAEMRVKLSRKYPKAEADTLLHQMQRGLAGFPSRVREDDSNPLCFAVEVTPSTVKWLEEVIAELWPSRRPEK